MSANGNGQMPAGMQPEAGDTLVGQALLEASLQAGVLLVGKAKASDSAAEAKDFTQSVVNLAQVIALLDPTRDQQGVPLDHQLQLTKMKGDLELEKERERARAQKPTPAKKKVNVSRDQHGRPASYEVEES